MKVPNNLVGAANARVWISVALEVAKIVIPIVQRELRKRWRKRRK